MDNMEVEIPDPMVDFEADQMVEDMARRIQAQGIPFEQYLSMMGMNLDMFRAQAKVSAMERVRRDLALGAVIAAEGIEISDEELEAEYNRLAEEYKMELDQVKAAAPADDVKKDLAVKKAEQVIYDSAKVGKAPAKKKAAKKAEGEAAEGEEKPKRRRTTKKKEEEAPAEEAPAQEQTEE